MTRPSVKVMTALTAGMLLQFAQAGQPNQDEPIRLRGELVVVDAQVLHKKTALAVSNLVREDFILYEDGVKQHISHFSRDKLPLSVIVLVDVSGSVWPNLKSFERLRRGALEALKLLKREDEVALMQFAQKATLVQPFTRDRDLVVNALARLDGRGQYGTYVAEGILAAASYMRSASNADSRRAIIAITDDVTVEFKERSSAAPMTQGEGEALRELYESGSVVCAILYKGDQIGFEDPYFKKEVAKRLAESTGGITIRTSQEDIPTRLTEMIERLRQRYTIGYSPSNTARDPKLRRIKLSVTPEVERREGAVAVITRKGYYAK
jgi:VWFA-related protein